jgi:serine protease Do
LGTPFGFNYSVNAGIVSAYPRFLPGGNGEGLIQTDVAMNPGSSGGPLFNARGLVVGMSSMVYSDTGLYMGVSFAVPIDRVLAVARELESRGSVRRVTIGAKLQPVNPGLARAFGMDVARGAIVVEVIGGQPAAKAGLQGGDVILAIDGAAMPVWLDIESTIAAAAPGKPLNLEVWRNQRMRRVVVHPVEEAADPPVDLPAREPAREARLGLALIMLEQRSAFAGGLYVGSAAGSGLVAGIESGDRILAVNGTRVSNVEGFDAALAKADKATVVALLVARGPVTIYLPVERVDR